MAETEDVKKSPGGTDKPAKGPDGGSAAKGGSGKGNGAGSPFGGKHPGPGKGGESHGDGAGNQGKGSDPYGGMTEGYLTEDDIGQDKGAEVKNGKGNGKGGIMNKRGLMAMGSGVMTAAKAGAALGLKMLLKTLLSMMQGLANTVGAMAAGFLQAVANLASAIGVSVAVVFGGIAGILAVVGVAVATAVTSYEGGAVRDTPNPCDEPYVFVYESTPSGDTMDAARKVYAFFHELGYTDTNIAGILGNWDVESGVDPTGSELIYDEPFVDLSSKTADNHKKYKVSKESHEACQCEWLVAMIARGHMEAIEWADDAHTKPTKYKYLLSDPEYDDYGNPYTVHDREFEFCHDCDEGYSVECVHGYTGPHGAYSGGPITCSDGYEVKCEHGFAEKHHIAAYHAIGFRTRCLDWTFTPPGVMSEGNADGYNDSGELEWVYADDETIPDYDKEDGESEGFAKYDTNSNYRTVYCGIGLGQWTNGRNRMLLRFAEDHGMDWSAIETQLAFMVAEDGDAPAYRKFLSEWKEEPNPQQAAMTFTVKWEGNTKAGIADRKQRAASWYVTISEWHQSGEFDAGGEMSNYAQSILSAAQATAGSATNVAAGRQLDSCGEFVTADNSSIADAAVSYAWHDKSMASNNGTALWRCVKDAVLGEDDLKGATCRYKSCDRTVATAIRWSGADASFPAGDVGAQRMYMANSPKWQLISWDGNEETLIPGDILIRKDSSVSHVMVYAGNEAVAAKYPDLKWDSASGGPKFCIVDGSIDTRSPACKAFDSSCRSYSVYRCIRPDGTPMTVGCNGLSGTEE